MLPSVWPGMIPADSVQCGPTIVPSPTSMYSSPKSAAIGKQIAEFSPKCLKRRACALPERIAAARANHSQAYEAASPTRLRRRSDDDVTSERNVRSRPRAGRRTMRAAEGAR